MNEWEMKWLARTIVACLTLYVVLYWFSPQGWIGQWAAEYVRAHP